MSCALYQLLSQRLESPDHVQLLEDLLTRYQNDPQYFLYLKPSLEHSLPKELGFDERVVRMTCDNCALDPLEECTFVDALLLVLQEHVKNGPKKDE